MTFGPVDDNGSFWALASITPEPDNGGTGKGIAGTDVLPELDHEVWTTSTTPTADTMAQTQRWGSTNGNGSHIAHSWGQDAGVSAGDSSAIAPWLEAGADGGSAMPTTLEPSSPPATKRSFLSSKASLHPASHQPSVGSLFKPSRPGDLNETSTGSLTPPAVGYGEGGPGAGKKAKGLFSLLKRKASKANVRPGSAGAEEDSYHIYSQSSLSLAGPSSISSSTVPPSPPPNVPKKSRKTSRARNAQPHPVAEFTLDTNLDEMEGIIARPGPQHPPWHEDGPEAGMHIVGPTGITGVQSPTAAFFTDPFSRNAFPPTSPSSGNTVVPRPTIEPLLQANGHRPGSPTAGVGPLSGIARNIPSPTLPRSDWAAPESWAVDGTGPKEDDYSSESDDALTPSNNTITGSLPGRSDSIAGSVSTSRMWKPPGSAGSDGGATRVGLPDPSKRGDTRLNSAGSVRSYGPGVPRDASASGLNGFGPGMGARGSDATFIKNWPSSFNVRVYRTDGTYHVVSCPLQTTVAGMHYALGRKLGLPKESHRLHLWERNRERALGNHERPALIMRRRLEQAGYDEIDQLEIIGGEDLRFLLRFVYRSVNLGGPGIDEEELSFDTFERVDLTGRGLQTVPIVLHRHASTITFLNLSKNPLVDLPLDFIQGCDELRELRLSTCSLKRIPASVQHSTSLHWLDLSCNRIVDLENAGLDNIPDLRTIKLQNNRLTGLPSYFAQLNSMRYLNISNNKLEVVPPVVCSMRSLIDLDMSFNSISVLPDGLGNLCVLERLVVVGNQISAFPEEISKLERLKWVDCRRNTIADLSLVTRLPSLYTLRADHNAFLVLDLPVAKSLHTFEASFNSITRFTLSGSEIETYALNHLDLSHAKLSSLEEDIFKQLPQLTQLRLDYNKFKTLPSSIGKIASLTSLSCTNNDLASLPESIGALQKLRRLNVRNNNIQKVPVEIWYCEELQEINCSSNLLQVWPDPPVPNGSTSERKGSGAGLAEGVTGVAAKPVPPLALSLQRLMLADNQLLDDVFHPLAILRDLRVLNLSFNQISEMPSFRLQTFAQLEELYLSGNRLTSFPADDLERLQKLNVLFLNANKLQTLPAELRKVKKLTSLDVGSNVLKYNMANFPFDWNWDFNRDLRYLNLSGNKRLVVKPLDNKMSPPSNAGRSGDKQDNGFSVLRDIRVLGLIDATVMVPSVPDESDERRVRTSFSEINGMAYGISDTLGKLEQLNTFDLAVPHFRGRENECLFGIFGRAAPVANSNRLAKYLHENFSQTLLGFLKSLKTDRGETTPDAIRRTFLSLNKTLYDHLLPPTSTVRKMSQASTTAATKTLDPMSLKASAAACVVYFVDKMMYVANVGSSLAVISRRGTPHELSRKHDPFDREETTRIRAAEGWVSPKGFVNDEPDCDESRAFGAYHLLPAVNARPDVHSWQLTDLDEFVIIGNRGLWDYMDPQTAVDIVRDSRARREEPMISAQTLRDHAISYGAEGNTMVMVISVSDKFTSKAADTTESDAILALKRTVQPRRSDLVADRTLNRLDKEVPPPVGQIALVFTDIRNSTSLWEKNPGMSSAMRTHNSLCRRLLRLCGGYEVKTEGDAFIVSFQSAPAALLWCFNVQTGLCDADWPIEILESEDGKEIFGENGEILARGLSVRMGIHWGAPVCEADPITGRMDYFGPMVNRSARVSATAIGGEIMISGDALKEIRYWLQNTEISNEEGEKSEIVRVVEQLKMLDPVVTEVGERRLKGLEVPELLSSILPRSLVGRWKLSQSTNTPAAASRVQFSVEQIRQLGMLCARLEALSSGRVFRDIALRRNPSAPSLSQIQEAENTIMYANPTLLMPDIRKDASDEDLLTILDSLSLRIENALGNMQRHQISGYDEVLSQLGAAIRLDPSMIMQALVMFQGITTR